MKKLLNCLLVVLLLVALPCIVTESSMFGDDIETASANGNAITGTVVADTVSAEKEADDAGILGISADVQSGDAIKTQLVVAYDNDSLVNDDHYVSSTGNYYLMEYDSEADAAVAEEAFANDENATSVENPVVLDVAETDGLETSDGNNFIITDPLSGTGTAFDSTYLSYGPEAINADDFAADLMTKYATVNNMPEVVVAVVDTGIDSDHTFLSDRLIPSSYNFITSGSTSSEDDNGHGTHVAGIIADTTLDNVKIKAYKVADSGGHGTDYSVACGINAAVADGVDVINVSMGGQGTSDVLDQAVANAYAAGVTVCVASGNANISADDCVPASCDGALTVGAVNSDSVIASFSNYGSCVELTAPGVDINSSYVGGFYVTLTGTSMATPFVSASAAMLCTYDPTLTATGVQNLLTSYATDLGTSGWDEYYGYGEVNLSLIESGDCILSFDSNGGSTVDDITAAAGDVYPTLPTPTLTGYDFTGWYSMSGELVSAGDTVGNVGRVKLTAHWTPKVVNLTFDANGGSVDTTPMTITYGSDFTLPTPTWTGHTFNGWYTPSGVQLSDASTFSLTADTALTAHWTVNTYIVYYDANGGGCIVSAQYVTYGSTYNDLAIPTWPGHVFNGWFAPSGEQITNGLIVDITEDMTLTAHWTANSYIITLNPMGGSCEITSIVVTSGGCYGTLPTPTKDHYTFTGWYMNTQLITADSIANVAADSVVLAGWLPATYTVTFDTNGGSADTTSTTVTYNSTYGTLPAPTRAGYTFNGWYTSSGDQITASSAVTLSADTTLIAHWIANTYTVTFDANGGNLSTDSKVVAYDSPYGTLPTPTRVGYTFVGWHTSNGALITADSTVGMMADMTLTAQWTANTYTVTFNANGGSCATSSITATYDGTYGTLPTPTRVGYTFNGWFTASGVQITDTAIVSLTANTTLTASWTANTYTVTFNANGGSCSTNSKTVTYGGNYGTLPTPTRTGYTFNGWFLPNGSSVYPLTSVTITANTTLTARWSIITYTLSASSGGNGSISPSSTTVNYGASQTFTITPIANYLIQDVKVDGTSVGAVSSYTFSNITSNHTISATFLWNNPYTDVNSGAWYYDAVRKVTLWNLFSGVTTTLFAPDDAMSRAMFVSVLYRYEGSPAVSGSTAFTDLTESWYRNAVIWASQNGIVAGTSSTTFSPYNSITREQVAVFLYRYCSRYKGYDVSAASSLSGYSDVNRISSYALTAMKWAVAKGYISGTSSTTLSPQDIAGRAQVALIFVNFIESL